MCSTLSAHRVKGIAAVVLTFVVASAFGVYVAPALGATRAQVVAAAKRGVIIELRRGGIHFRAIDIAAACTRARPTFGTQERWICRVRGNGSQCSGTLAVIRRAGSSALLVREFRVACGE